MSASYIPEKTFAVCTFQTSPSPQKFIATRQKVSVFHKEEPLLTKEDKNLEEQFVCKSPVSMAAAFLAFGAGLALVASGPIGWAIVGAALIAGAVYTVKAITHKCTGPMQSGDWMLFHLSVNFNGHNAITEISMLKCNNGGILKAFFSYSTACQAAKSIMWNNIAEVGTNAIIAFFAGRLGPGGLKTLYGAHTWGKATAILIGGNMVGLGITWTAQYFQRDEMRKDENLINNEIYQNMNEEVDPNSFSWSLDDPSDPNDLGALVAFMSAVSDGSVVVSNNNLYQDLRPFLGMTTAQLKNNPEVQRLFKNIKNGNYGSEARTTMKNIFGKMKINRSAVNKGITFSEGNIKTAMKNMGKNAGTGALFFLPFIATIFSENARKYFAEAAMRDIINGTNVVASNPLGM